MAMSSTDLGNPQIVRPASQVNSWVTGAGDERAGPVFASAARLGEERDPHLVVVAEIVVAVVDHGDDELGPTRAGLHDLEVVGDQRLCLAGVDVEHRGACRRVSHHARHRDRLPGDLVGGSAWTFPRPSAAGCRLSLERVSPRGDLPTPFWATSTPGYPVSSTQAPIV